MKSDKLNKLGWLFCASAWILILINIIFNMLLGFYNSILAIIGGLYAVLAIIVFLFKIKYKKDEVQKAFKEK